MRVLLSGATGAIGQQLVPQLIAAGHEVVAVVRTRGALDGTGAAEIHADLLDRASVLDGVAGQRFDAVMHQATALKKAPTLYSHLATTNRLRTEGTSTLIAAARATGAKRFVTASVFYGYGLYDHGPDLVTEAATFARRTSTPLDPILAAALSNEQQVRAFGGTVLRYGLFYGDGFAPLVASDWRGVLPLVHREDAAAAAVQALSHGTAGSTYNIADDRPASWAELQQSQAVAAGRRMPVALSSGLIRAAVPFAAELLTRTSMRLDTSLAARELRWQPLYPSFADGLRASVTLG